MMNKVISGTLTSLVLSVAFWALPAYALDNNTAFSEAEKLEAAGQYSLAASAYLAIVEGFDFMPSKTVNESYSPSEKAILNKLAVNCMKHAIIEREMKGLKSGFEPQFLGAASYSLEKLEAQKPALVQTSTPQNPILSLSLMN